MPGTATITGADPELIGTTARMDAALTMDWVAPAVSVDLAVADTAGAVAATDGAAR